MAKLNVKVITNDYKASDGKHYYIVKTTLNGKTQYGVIDYEWVDENGRLNREINGINMKLQNTVAELITLVEQDVKYRKLKAEGIDDMVALIMAMYNMTKEEAEAAYNKAC